VGITEQESTYLAAFMNNNAMKPVYLILFCLLLTDSSPAQSNSSQISAILEPLVQSPEVPVYQLRRYLLDRVPELPKPESGQQWTVQANRLRQHLLDEIVFHGWPKEWVTSPANFEDLGVLETGKGYRLRKLRYEIVPGFYSSAILYEPEKLEGRVPAILNVNGHVGAPGKSVEYKQKRCINYALQGMLALNLEWLACGELLQKENQHSFGAHLNLVGTQGVGLFYLAMRRGLDYLATHPQADPHRLGVTGLSGGGWQTIVLSALDERVAVSIPVAGYSSLASRLEEAGDGSIGDNEQNPTDLLKEADYTQLTAMRAPRPTLLIYNAEDDCCFRAPLIKAPIFDEVNSFFRLFGNEDALAWHENLDPGTHNYQVENRIQSYRFFSRHFSLPLVSDEIPVDSEIKSYEELVVGLPKDNLTILGLAKRLSERIQRPPLPADNAAKSTWAASERAKLKAVVRFHPATLAQLWPLANTKNKGVESISYRFEFKNGLSAAGVWMKSIRSRGDASSTLVLNDKGKKASADDVSDRVNRGEQVLALDPLLIGDSTPNRPDAGQFTMMLEALGERMLGLQAAQVIAAALWLQEKTGNRTLRLESRGPRCQTIALIAAALEPTLFSEVTIGDGMLSLGHLLKAPVPYSDAPELFCLDLYKEFDLDRLALLAGPAKVIVAQAPVAAEH
jgi:dienelactone hydrolase